MMRTMLIKFPGITASLCLCALSLLWPWHAGHAFDLQGHRGARGLAPENTLAAFERALEIGVTTLELDVGLTADGVVVVSHDPYLNPSITRTADGKWLESRGPLIKNLTFAAVQRYDVGRIQPDSAYARTFSRQQPRDGERIPALATLFQWVKSRAAHEVRFNIETKLFPTQAEATAEPHVLTRALLDVIQQEGMSDRVSIQSFDWRSLQLVQKWAPSIPTVCLSVQSASANNLIDGQWTAGLKLAEHATPAHMVKAAGGKVWSPNFNDLSQSSVAQAQGLGLQVIPWTVNSEADLKRMIDWRVDGIITDYPDRLRDLMRERGMTLPKGQTN
jgi:glycerophosphoryl diester phosphodiesterase